MWPSVAGTTSQKCQTWNCRERGPGQEDGGYWDCGCGCESNFASRSRCRSCGVVRGRYQQQQGQSGRTPQFTQSTFAAVVAEEAAKLHAQLGQGAIDVPMMETGQDVAPSEEAERKQLRTLLTNLDASIGALTPVAAGDEDVCQILQAKQEKRKRVQAQLSAVRPLRTRLRAAHEKANKKYKALVEEEESVMALLLAKQRLTQQAKEARDLKAKGLEEVEVEARTAREGSAQSTRNSSTRSSSPMSPAQWAAGLQNALDGDVKESFNLKLEQFGVQAHQFQPQQKPVQIQAAMLSHHSPSRSPQSWTTLPVEGAARSVETISIGSAEEDGGRLFRPESRFPPY